MITYFQPLLDRMAIHPPLREWVAELPKHIDLAFAEQRNGNLPAWREALEQLPELSANKIVLQEPVVKLGSAEQITPAQQQKLYSCLQTFCPWRKGPFTVFGLHIDSEWRSDRKWARVQSAISSLKGRTVLDVGCGNGYYLYRMLGEGANLIVGIDPYLLFVMQSLAIANYAGEQGIPVLPVAAEQIPENIAAFDTLFSMGVLYHRRSPFDHLYRLKSFLQTGGELVLETLVIEGKAGEVLVPDGRYAKMNNVWFIPSVPELVRWLERVGFVNVKVVDCSLTTSDEQRRTDWMRFESLADYLDPTDSLKTIEGYPAPRRALLVATKP